MAYTDYLDTVQKYYIAYYQRPADPQGLRYWAEKLDAANGAVGEIIEAFANSAESTSLYGEITEDNIDSVVTAIYQAAFGRDPDAGGLQHYIDGFKDGTYTAATLMVNIADGATGNDATVLDNKIQAATTFTETLDPDFDQDPSDDRATYSGDTDAQAARDWLATVTDTVPAAEDVENEVKTNIADSGDPIVNVAPDAADDAFTAAAGETLTIDTSELLVNDADPDGDDFTFVSADNATNGDIAVVDGKIVFIPEDDTVRDGSFEYTVEDSNGNQSTATVNVVFSAAPEAAAVAAEVDEDAVLTGTLSATDADGDAITYSLVEDSVTNGTVVVNEDGTYTYTPDENFNGDASFQYVATDEYGAVSDPATVSVTVNSVNDTPVVVAPEPITIAENSEVVTGQLEATDVDGDTLTFIETPDIDGLTINEDGSYTFDPSLNPDVQALTYTDEPLTIEAGYTVDDGNGSVVDGTLSITAEPTPLTFTLQQSTATVEEGSVVEYTIVASEAVQEDFTGNIQITLADGDTASLDDFGSGSFNAQPVTIAAGETTSTVATITPTNDATTEMPETFTVTAAVDGYEVADIQTTVQDPSSVGGLGQTFNLTTGVDEIPGLVGSAGSTGTDGDDTIVGVIDGTTPANQTFSALDSINGGLGDDTLKINNTSAVANDATDLSIATISNIETITMQAVGDISNDDVANVAGTNEVDFTSISGLETINATKSKAALIKAADTTDVNVSGASDLISVVGGKNVVVDDGTAVNNITIGGTTAPAGTITVTDTDQGAAAVAVDGGTDVSVTTTSEVATGTITVGASTPATGTVNVTQNLESDGEAALDNTSGGITVTGGTSITINSNATSDAKDEDSDADITMHNIAATGSEDTTEVTVTQTATVNTVSTPAEDVVKATHEVTFKALNAGQTTTLNGLSFTASKNLTAAEVAQAFANLTVDDTQSETGPTVNGFYTGAFSGVSGWTSGAADGDKVVFTAPAHNTALKMSAGGDVAPDISAAIEAGTAAVAPDESANNITYGDVAVDDHAGTADATIETITIDGYNNAAIGATNNVDALTDLTLRNSDGATTLYTNVTSLNLTLDNIGDASTAAVSLDTLAANVETLTITTENEESDVNLTAAAVTALTVNAGVDLDLSSSTMSTVLETVSVTGAGAVDLSDISTTSALNSFDASGNTGGVTATIDANSANVGDIEEYLFSDGADAVTLADATVDVDVTLAAGDDVLELASYGDGTIT